ncbi:MAG: TIGR03862 family flavoprotein [Hahellaceae bacterium]|nr:TIGR03862 family flavoprotein [Hahellaceae bacterium]
MAAEVLSNAGVRVDLYDAMPSVGRKFLLAGVGGMNITHSEPEAHFISRYREAAGALTPYLQAFSATRLRHWIHELGVDTFVGTSGRVFPTDMKAAPLLRVWLHRLKAQGVRFHVRHKWQGWDDQGDCLFDTPQGTICVKAPATVLALGGGSWKKLGSDGAWVPWLESTGVGVAPLKPTNCGFDVDWSPFIKAQVAGQPLKSVALSIEDELHHWHRVKGEFIVSQTGVEGSLIYALSALIRRQIEHKGVAELLLDLKPDHTEAEVIAQLQKPRGSDSFSNHLRKKLNISKYCLALLKEYLSKETFQDMVLLGHGIKHLKLQLRQPRPIDEAISTAGGVGFASMDSHLMLIARPGVFCAGEMLDWEAPTGGYLLTACFATGRAAGEGALTWLKERQRKS